MIWKQWQVYQRFQTQHSGPWFTPGAQQHPGLLGKSGSSFSPWLQTLLFSAHIARFTPAGHMLVPPQRSDPSRQPYTLRPYMNIADEILPLSKNLRNILQRRHARSVDMLRIRHRPRFDTLPHQVIWRHALRFLWVHKQRRLDVSRWNRLQ